jgi:hypothetical protein
MAHFSVDFHNCSLLYFGDQLGDSFAFGNSILSAHGLVRCGSLLLLGQMLGNKASVSDFNRDSRIFNDIKTKKYFIVAVVSFCIWISEILRNNVIVFGLRNESYSFSMLAAVSLVFMGFSLFVWLYDLSWAITNDRFISLQGFFSLLIYISPNLVMAGRQTILVGGVSTVLTYIYNLRNNSSYRYRRRLRIIAVAGIVVIIQYFSLLLVFREGSVDRNTMYQYMFNSITSDTTLKMVEWCGPLERTMLQTIYYYGSILSGFESMYENYNALPLFGMYQLQYISRRFPGKTGQSVENARLILDEASYKDNMYMQIYRTALRGFIIDFGRIGAAVFSGILLFLIGRSRKRFLQSKNLYQLVLQCLICSGMVFSIEYSPFFDGNTWAYPFYCLLTIPMIEKAVKGFTER